MSDFEHGKKALQDLIDWARGEFAPMVNKFGKGGFWHVQRMRLSDLLDEERIRALVTDPLRAKYVEVFRGGAEKSQAIG